MGGNHGVENAKKLAIAIGEFGEVGYGVVKTDAGAFERARMALSLADDVASLIGIDYNELKKEVGELDASDKAQIVTAFKDAFDLPDDGLENIVEVCLTQGLVILEAGQAIAKAFRP